MENKKYLIILLMGLFVSMPAFADEPVGVAARQETGYEFTRNIELPAMPVKDQARTGTCWSFATVSFIESELIRMGKGEHDLSEMFFVRYVYPEKAERYIRFHGNLNFWQGSLSHDVMNVVQEFGFVPDEVYRGLEYGTDRHNHGELVTVLENFLDGVLARRSGALTPVWPDAYNAILDVYLGEVPEQFTYNGRSYTPQSFVAEMDFDPSDYVEIASFSHQPFYEEFVLEVPDNWAHELTYNLPLNEMMDVINYSLANGYTIAWDGDVSERTFSSANGLALMPEKTWAERTEEERRELFRSPQPEEIVTQESRQASFDDFSTTDDHLMHITGTATDQNGSLYYLTKNSHGENNDMGGYLYMSESYVKKKTVFVMVHKDAIPPAIRTKLGL